MNWFQCKNTLGPIHGLEHPPKFNKNIYAIAGHWKINKQLVQSVKLGWFDPFMGHGESPLLAAKLNIKYVGHDTNRAAFDGYLNHIQDSISFYSDKVKMYNRDSTTFYPELENGFDLCYTSPPYFDFEEYQYFLSQIYECDSYESYHDKITIPVFSNVKRYLTDDGILALQVEKDKKYKDLWIKTITEIGYKILEESTQGCINRSIYSKKDQNLLIFKKI